MLAPMRQTLRVADALPGAGTPVDTRGLLGLALAAPLRPPLPARREPSPRGCDSAVRGVRGPQ
jgi:hypothetical protein